MKKEPKVYEDELVSAKQIKDWLRRNRYNVLIVTKDVDKMMEDLENDKE